MESQCPWICVSVCLCQHKTPTSGCRGDLWLKNVFIILACNDRIKKKSGLFFIQEYYNARFWTPPPPPRKKYTLSVMENSGERTYMGKFFCHSRNESWHKTDRRNAVSGYLRGSLQRHLAAIFACDCCSGRPVDNIRNFGRRKQLLVNCLLDSLGTGWPTFLQGSMREFFPDN